MIILHAGILRNNLVFWAEKSESQESSLSSRKDLDSRDHPFSAEADLLLETLKVLDFRPVRKHLREAAIWLPSQGGRPLPSSPLIGDIRPARTQIKAAPWLVKAYSAEAGEVLDLLSACLGRSLLAPGIVAGNDLVYWTAVLRFAALLVVRQQYLPDLVEDGEYRAVWEPILTGEYADQLHTLTERLPSSARALSDPEAVNPPELPVPFVIKQFVRVLVDQLVRSALVDQQRLPARQFPFNSVHDAWLQALRSADSAVQAEKADLIELRTQLNEWRRPVAIREAAPFRLCFRLEEPEENQPESWYIRYLLQPKSDPSLLIPAPDLWKRTGRAASMLKRYGANAREYLLSSLGQSAAVSPKIAASLKTSAPAGFELNTPSAHHFLSETSYFLADFGFGVLLPAWWTGKGTKNRLGLRARVKSPAAQTKATFSYNEIVDFNWEVALGGKTLTLRELEAMAKLKAPLVRLRGQWVEVRENEIQAAISLLKKQRSSEESVKGLVRMALGDPSVPAGFEFLGVKADGWLGKLLRDLEEAEGFEELPAPASFSGTLRPYQIRGYSWLSFLRKWGLGACLADDMGLGKTVQTLALIQKDWHSNEKRPVLLICPTSVIHNWHREAARFTPELPVLVHYGAQRIKNSTFGEKALEHAVVLSSYGILQRDLKLFKEVPWSGIIVDEAQNIKNPETKQAKTARSLTADYRVALTGTPVENNIGDLWSIMEFLNPGLLGTQADFKRRFFIPIQAGRDSEAAQQLKKLTGPFILRRLKTDKTIISDLPEKLETKVFCTLTREQASLYAAVLKDMEIVLDSAEGIERKGVILGALSKLKQVCNHPAQFLRDHSQVSGRSGKLSRLTEMLDEILEVGDRCLIFSQFAEMGGILKEYLQETFGREVLFLHGKVPKAKRDRMIEDFQTGHRKPPIFVLSLKAGGTGLNLTGANHVFHFDRWWNPAVENQATDRAFRIGQTRNVQVHKFICAGTLEEKIDEMVDRKKEIAEKVIGSGESWITELSNKELKEIFRLHKDAVGE